MKTHTYVSEVGMVVIVIVGNVVTLCSGYPSQRLVPYLPRAFKPQWIIYNLLFIKEFLDKLGSEQ